MPPPARGIDPRGPRFAAGITALLLLVDVFLGLTTPLGATVAERALEPAFLLLVAIALLFLWSVVSPRTAPWGVLYRCLVQPRLKPPAELEDPRPPRFAQGVGLFVVGDRPRPASGGRAVGAADRRGRGVRRGVPQRGLRAVPRLPALPRCCSAPASSAASAPLPPEQPDRSRSERSRPRMPAVRLTARRPEGGRTPIRRFRMTVTSEATAVWKGGLFDGSGKVTLQSSGNGTFDVNWKARSEGSTSVTTPEELIAAAHSVVLQHGVLARARRERHSARVDRDDRIRHLQARHRHHRQPPERQRGRPRTRARGLRPHRGRRQGELPGLAGPRGHRDHARGHACLIPADGPRRVVVAGASGLIGSALVDSLRADGISVTTLVRRPAETADEVEWLTDSSPLDPAVLDGADAVVGLNGASASAASPGRAHYKSTLLWSRITPTRALARAMRELGADAPAFVSASAVGYYGSAPGALLTEKSPRGETFLADLCGEWESAALAAGEHARVALLRTAPIVHPKGVLKPLMLLTRVRGRADPIGRGTQKWPWISLDDEVRGIRHVIDSDVAGPGEPRRTDAARAPTISASPLAVRMNRPFLLRAPVWGMKLVPRRGRDRGAADDRRGGRCRRCWRRRASPSPTRPCEQAVECGGARRRSD